MDKKNCIKKETKNVAITIKITPSTKKNIKRLGLSNTLIFENALKDLGVLKQ